MWGSVGGEMGCVEKCGVGAGKCVRVWGEVKKGVVSVLEWGKGEARWRSVGKCGEVWESVLGCGGK